MQIFRSAKTSAWVGQSKSYRATPNLAGLSYGSLNENKPLLGIAGQSTCHIRAKRTISTTRPIHSYSVRRFVMIVREYDHDADFEGLRACLIELQNFERRIDPRMSAG